MERHIFSFIFFLRVAFIPQNICIKSGFPFCLYVILHYSILLNACLQTKPKTIDIEMQIQYKQPASIALRCIENNHIIPFWALNVQPK